LINLWKKLLINEEIEPDTAELETEDFHNTFHQGSENLTTLEDIELWLETDEDDLGYHILTEEEIVESVVAAENFETDEYEQNEVVIRNIQFYTIYYYFFVNIILLLCYEVYYYNKYTVS